MEKEQNTVELTRSMYKEIKSMNRDQMQQVLTNIYDQGLRASSMVLSSSRAFVKKSARSTVSVKNVSMK